VIVVSDRGRVIRVPVSDVLYMKAELKYVTLRTAEHTHVLDDSLAELAERLGDRFLRVHRKRARRQACRARARAARDRWRERRRRHGSVGRLHRACQRMARGLAAPWSRRCARALSVPAR
jgi:two-component system response regulator AlgR